MKTSTPPGLSSACALRNASADRRHDVLEHVAGDEEVERADARVGNRRDVEPRLGVIPGVGVVEAIRQRDGVGGGVGQPEADQVLPRAAVRRAARPAGRVRARRDAPSRGSAPSTRSRRTTALSRDSASTGTVFARPQRLQTNGTGVPRGSAARSVVSGSSRETGVPAPAGPPARGPRRPCAASRAGEPAGKAAEQGADHRAAGERQEGTGRRRLSHASRAGDAARAAPSAARARRACRSSSS